MRHRKHTFKVGRTSSHRRAMMANMACSLIAEEQIKTTVVKAKELRRVVERMVTLGKRGTLHARRQAIAYLGHVPSVRILFDAVAPRYAEREGGYTRILRLGNRLGDGSEMCLIQLLNEPVVAKDKRVPAAVAAEPVAAVATSTEAAEESVSAEEGDAAEKAE